MTGSSVPTTKPPGKGWSPWVNTYGRNTDSPYNYVEVETWRKGWHETNLQVPESHPLQNAVGLWWRPAGPKRSPEEQLRVAAATLYLR